MRVITRASSSKWTFYAIASRHTNFFIFSSSLMCYCAYQDECEILKYQHCTTLHHRWASQLLHNLVIPIIKVHSKAEKRLRSASSNNAQSIHGLPTRKKIAAKHIFKISSLSMPWPRFHLFTLFRCRDSIECVRRARVRKHHEKIAKDQFHS